MKKLLLPLFALLLTAAIPGSLSAQIVLDEPVIEMGSYIGFSGTNATNNYRFTLDTYEWSDSNGPHFQLVISRLDDSKPAAFTASDLTDANYWEAAFRRYTEQLAGEAMEASENIKRLTVNNVALLPNQFEGYGDGMNEVCIISDGGFIIPDGCFARGATSHYSIKKLTCQIGGTLKLGSKVVDHSAGGLNIYTYDRDIAYIWKNYKDENGAAFSIWLDDEPYDGAPAPDPFGIAGVSATITVNGSKTVMPVPDQGGSADLSSYGAVTQLVLDDFTATTTGDVTEVFMEYAIVPEDFDWSNRPDWKQVYAEKTGEGVWTTDGANINVLEGLENYSAYSIALGWHTSPDANTGSRAHFPTDGRIIHLSFKTGLIPSGLDEVQTDEKAEKTPAYDLLGRRTRATEKGIVIRDGKKVILK